MNTAKKSYRVMLVNGKPVYFLWLRAGFTNRDIRVSKAKYMADVADGKVSEIVYGVSPLKYGNKIVADVTIDGINHVWCVKEN